MCSYETIYLEFSHVVSVSCPVAQAAIARDREKSEALDASAAEIAALKVNKLTAGL